MAWSVGNQITAAKLNSENYTPSWQLNWTDPNTKTTTESFHKFYYHDCGGNENPILISWAVNVYTTYSWGNYGPDCHAWIEKRTAAGATIGSRITLFQFDNSTINISENLTRQEAIDAFGSAEGWYYIAYNLEGDVHGGGTINLKAYGYPTNCKVNGALRYFDNPTSSGFAAPNTIELSATNLNTHRVGTY